jgi:DNA-binding Lrp family transcriptional regulator
MDTLDHQFISLIAGQRPYHGLLEMARSLGVSRATVQNRMRRLERDGVILGYAVRLQAPGSQARIRASTPIQVDGYGDVPVIERSRRRNAATNDGRWDRVAGNRDRDAGRL